MLLVTCRLLWGMTDLTADQPDLASVERFVPAPAEAIFDLLADPSRHQQIDGSGTVKGAPQGSQRLALGATFGMSMKMGIGYSMQNTVVEFEENRRIAWQPRPSLSFMRHFVGGRIWRYELEPVEGGTMVRESWDISHEVIKRSVRPLRSKTIDSMTKTLERIERAVTT
ncbi:MAG: SRPBCC family protein [Actinomycetota bacterium]